MSPERLGVVVLGMHRSGTSAAARLLSLLGLSLGPEEELLPAQDDNPSGFWENGRLVQTSDEVLHALGGSWSAPPRLDEGWQHGEELDPLRQGAAELLRTRFVARQWVWKGPRTCLTLPFWLTVLEDPIVFVVFHRNPLEVAESLRARDGFPAALGLALWERYLRSTLALAAGCPTFVGSYEDVLRDPVAWCEQVALFLRERGAEIGPVPSEEVAAYVRRDLRHATFDDAALESDPLVSQEQRALQTALVAARGAHTSFAPPELPPETPWVEPLLAERRGRLGLEHAERQSRAAREAAEAELAAIRTSRSYRAFAAALAVGRVAAAARGRLRARRTCAPV